MAILQDYEKQKNLTIKLGKEGASNEYIVGQTGLNSNKIAGILHRAGVKRKKKAAPPRPKRTQPASPRAPSSMTLLPQVFAKRRLPVSAHILAADRSAAQHRPQPHLAFSNPNPPVAKKKSMPPLNDKDMEFGGRRSPYPLPQEVSGNTDDLKRGEIFAIIHYLYRPIAV